MAVSVRAVDEILGSKEQDCTLVKCVVRDFFARFLAMNRL